MKKRKMTQEQLDFEYFYTNILYHIYTNTPIEDPILLEEAYIKSLNTLLIKGRQDESVIIDFIKTLCTHLEVEPPILSVEDIELITTYPQLCTHMILRSGLTPLNELLKRI